MPLSGTVEPVLRLVPLAVLVDSMIVSFVLVPLHGLAAPKPKPLDIVMNHDDGGDFTFVTVCVEGDESTAKRGYSRFYPQDF